MDYSRICFVVMPFGKKNVKLKDADNDEEIEIEINFDFIYKNIFKPAIEMAVLPEGRKLEARRVDKDFFSGDIGQELFEYLEYSRVVLTDITGLNANVFYELGVRHRARPSGTVILRLLDAPIPFDINHIKAFPYQYDPEEHIERSKKDITQILIETLQHNKLDSPSQIALKAQQGNPAVDLLLTDAENSLRNNDIQTAIKKYDEALSYNNNNILIKMKLGILYKELGEWEKALNQFVNINTLEPTYYEAFKERGIAENKIYSKNPDSKTPSGEKSLIIAIKLNDEDYDAFSSLGGIFKREGRYKEALDEYNTAVKISRGHPYPLLNAIKIQAKINKKIEIDYKDLFYLKRAKVFLQNQVRNIPPYGVPWSYFDLAEIVLLLDQKEDSFIENIQEGINYCGHCWQPQTFLESLRLIEDVEEIKPYIDKGIMLLQESISLLK